MSKSKNDEVLLILAGGILVFTILIGLIMDKPKTQPCNCETICEKSPTGYKCGLSECPSGRK